MVERKCAIPQGEPTADISENLSPEEHFDFLLDLAESVLKFYAGRDNDGSWKKISTAAGPQFIFNWKPDTQDHPQEMAERALAMINDLKKERPNVQTTQ